MERHFEEWEAELKEVADRWRRVLFAFGGEEGSIQLATPDDANEVYEPLLALLLDGARMLDEMELQAQVLEVPEVVGV